MLVANCNIARETYLLPARETFTETMRVSDKPVALPSFEAVVDPSSQLTLMEIRTDYP